MRVIADSDPVSVVGSYPNPGDTEDVAVMADNVVALIESVAAPAAPLDRSTTDATAHADTEKGSLNIDPRFSRPFADRARLLRVLVHGLPTDSGLVVGGSGRLHAERGRGHENEGNDATTN